MSTWNGVAKRVMAQVGLALQPFVAGIQTLGGILTTWPLRSLGFVASTFPLYHSFRVQVVRIWMEELLMSFRPLDSLRN